MPVNLMTRAVGCWLGSGIDCFFFGKFLQNQLILTIVPVPTKDLWIIITPEALTSIIVSWKKLDIILCGKAPSRALHISFFLAINWKCIMAKIFKKLAIMNIAIISNFQNISHIRFAIFAIFFNREQIAINSIKNFAIIAIAIIWIVQKLTHK